MSRLVRYSNEPGTVKNSFHHTMGNRQGTHKKEYRLYPERLFALWRKKTPGDKSNTSFFTIKKGVPSLFFETELTGEEAAASCDVDKSGNYYMLSASFQNFCRSFDKNGKQRWLSSPESYADGHGAVTSVCYAYFDIWVLGGETLFKFDIDTGELIDSYTSPGGDTDNLYTDIRYCMAETSIVFAYDENIIKFSLLDNTFEQHTEVVAGERIFDLIVDGEGNIYIAYYSGGVVVRKMDYNLNLIWEFDSGIGTNSIVLAVDEDDNVYFADNDGAGHIVKIATDSDGKNPTQEFRTFIESNATEDSLQAIIPSLDDGKIFTITPFPAQHNFFSIDEDGSNRTIIESGSVVGVDMITSRGRVATRGEEYIKPANPTNLQANGIKDGIHATCESPDDFYIKALNWYLDGSFKKQTTDIKHDFLELNAAQKYDVEVAAVDIFDQESAKVAVKEVVAGETVVIETNDDTWVHGNSPDATHGDEDRLAFYQNSSNGAFRSDVFIKFNISEYNEAVGSALLKLVFTGRNNSNNYDFAVYEVSDDSWNEETLTWNTKPLVGSQIGGSVSFPDPSPGDVMTFDVTSYVNDQIAADEDLISFMAESITELDNVYRFASKENTTHEAPKLEIVS